MTVRGMCLVWAAAGVLAGGAARAQSAPPSQPAAAAPTGNVENGKTIFTKYGCYECHGRQAHGGAGPKLGPETIPFAGFVRTVRRPPNQMPLYTAKVVTDQELADIYAFLKSLPRPARAETSPLLSP